MFSRKGFALAFCLAALGMAPVLAEPVGTVCEGIEACSLDWVPLEPSLWFYQTGTTHDGVDALQSGPVGEDEGTGLVTTIVGPATANFWVKVSSEEDSDFFAVVINGDIVDALSGEVDWTLVSYDLPEGVNQLAFAYVKDDSGSSAGADAAWVDSFVVAPTGSVLINGGAASTGAPIVTLDLNWADGSERVTRMRFSNNGSTWSAWEPVASTKDWFLAAGEGYKTVRVQFRDIAGNVSAAASDYIKVDMTAPTGGIVINNGQWITLSRDVTLGLNWADAGSGVSRMRFSNDGATWSAWEAVAPTKAWTLSAWGVRTVRVQFIDRAGNVSERYSDYINALT